MERMNIRPGHEISRVIKGGWQLGGGHGSVDQKRAVKDMFAFARAGITAFDFADIYTGVEEMMGTFLAAFKNEEGAEAYEQLKLHGKFVPDLDKLADVTAEYVEGIIDRTLKRLGRDDIDLVQFHWWDYAVPRYLETIHLLQGLQNKGKIRHIGVTNMDTEHLKEIVDSGVTPVSAQVQYSLLDRRPEKSLATFAQFNDIKLLCYGSLAGGFLHERYLGALEPQPPYENRSLAKYKLMIDEFGGWEKFQALLSVLQPIAKKHLVGIGTVAMRYVLDKPAVAAVIAGARDTKHLGSTLKVSSFTLDADDYARIRSILDSASEIPGEVYELERDRTGRHGRIMKYNLNTHGQ